MIISLTRCARDSVSSLKIISFHVTFGDEPYSKTMITKIMIADIPLVYNMIIGRSMLNRVRVVVPTYHMMMKFSIRISVGELRNNSRESYQYYLTIESLLKNA